MMPPDSRCLAADEMSLLFEGRLSAAAQARIDGHIDDCPRCFDLVAELARGLPPVMADADEPAGPASLAPGSSISGVLPRDALIQGRYQILELAGVGGMGVIYIAHDHTLDRRVALKVLRHDRRADPVGTDAQAHLVREAQTLARLSHPNVVVVYDVVHGVDGVHIAMELVEGRTLGAWLEGPPQPTRDQILAVFISAGRGLAAAHAAGVVHRDFKPDNVLVGLDGRVRVTDFGLARGPRPATATETDASIAGTPRYMAPEQRLGRGTDARSDQYSFAVALHEAIHGQHPAASPDPTPTPARGRVPRWLHRLLRRALSAEPGRRFTTMDELCDALERGRRARARLAWGLAAGSLVAAALGAVLLSRAPDTPLCEPATAQLVGVWDEPTRQAVRDAMTAATASAGGPAWATIEGELDAVASLWSERHDAACTTANTGDGPARQQASMILECLQQNREQIRVLTEMSARGDASALSFISRGRLRESMRLACATPEAARHIAPLPPDGHLRRRVVELRILLDEAFGIESKGQLAQARDLATLAVQQAEATGFEPVLSEALFRRGAIEHQMGDVAAAQTTLERALAIAEVAQHDRMIPEIWMAIVAVDTSLGRLAEASRGLDRATAFFTRQQLPPKSMARLHSKRALLLRALGRHREAITVEDQALALYRAGPDPEVFAAGSLTMQATSYAAIGAWDRALELDREALALRERLLGPDHTRVAGSLNNIGAALMATGDHEAARPSILRALTIREAVQGPDGLDVSHVLLNLAELERLAGRPALARSHLERALAIRERILGPRHSLVAEALHRLGALLTGQGELAAAVASLARARAILESSVGPTHPTTALVLATLAHAELARGDAATARPLLEAAVEILATADVRPDERAAAIADLALSRAQ
jgi:tetratricopeptide (TPR) repeat protein/predicted Ser/Thr protein kinase